MLRSLAIAVVLAGCVSAPARPGPTGRALPVPPGAVEDAWLVSRTAFATRGEDGRVAIYDLPGGQLQSLGLATPWDTREGGPVPGATAVADPCAPLRHGEVVAGYATGSIRRFPADLFLFGRREDLPALAGHSSAVTAVAIGPERSLLSGDEAGVIRRWDLAEGRLVSELRAEGRTVRAVGWIDALPAALDERGILFVWERDGAFRDRRDTGIRAIEEGEIVGWCADRSLWVARDQAGRAWVIEYDGSLAVRQVERAHRATIAEISLEGGSLRAWTSRGVLRTYLWPEGAASGPDEEGSAPPPREAPPAGFDAPGRPSAWARSGDLVAVATEEGWLAIWSASGGRRIALRRGPSSCLAFDPLGPALLRGTPDGWVVRERIADGEPFARWRAHDLAVNDLLVDGDLLVTAGAGSEPLEVWTGWR